MYCRKKNKWFTINFAAQINSLTNSLLKWVVISSTDQLHSFQKELSECIPDNSYLKKFHKIVNLLYSCSKSWHVCCLAKQNLFSFVPWPQRFPCNTSIKVRIELPCPISPPSPPPPRVVPHKYFIQHTVQTSLNIYSFYNSWKLWEVPHSMNCIF